jgi:hypothetical protein
MSLAIPGAQWWKVDLHTHTPASDDYGRGPQQAQLMQMTPQEWLLGFMRAGIDGVAVTDHNSGEWIDRLAEALAAPTMKQHPDYRPLVLFPGVEVTASSGIHVLGIFSPGTPGRVVTTLLGTVKFRGTPGSSQPCEEAALSVVREIDRAGGIPILAHADIESGAFGLPGSTFAQLCDEPSLIAVEVRIPQYQRPQVYHDKKCRWTEVVGSDAHRPDAATASGTDARYPGSHWTWIKMGSPPDLTGLRLALLDGNAFSVVRSDAPPSGFDPNRLPEDWIESIDIGHGRYMGRGQPQVLEFTPWLHALIGGRGTGKSTVVQFLRLALAQGGSIPEGSDAAEAWERFDRIPKTRDDVGCRTSDTTVRVIYRHAERRYRVTWKAGSHAVEEGLADGGWRTAPVQDVAARCPVRMFSQGQIQATARDSKALLDIVDGAIAGSRLPQRMEEERSRFFTLRAKAREMRQKLAGRDRIRAQLDDVTAKLTVLEQTQHAAVLREHQRRSRQLREVEHQLAEVTALASRLDETAKGLAVSDPAADLFDASDAVDAVTLNALAALRTAITSSKATVADAATHVREAQRRGVETTMGGALGTAAQQARQRYEELTAQLRQQGVQDTAGFSTLVQERQRLEQESRQLGQLADRLLELDQEAQAAGLRLLELRSELTAARQAFVTEALAENRHVRMQVAPYGDGTTSEDLGRVERSFRQELESDKFPDDILSAHEEVGAKVGMVAELYRNLPQEAIPRAQAIAERLKAQRRLLHVACAGQTTTLGGHFANYLQRECQKRPELLDRLLVWTPEDSLRVEYSATGDGQNFRPLIQGSPGQRSAAIMAFFLAFGSEPIVLDQPEDDLDNHLIYDLVVQQVRECKQQRQIIIVTHNPNIVVNGDAEMVHALDFRAGQCRVIESGALQRKELREEVCQIMEGGREAFTRRFRRLGEP